MTLISLIFYYEKYQTYRKIERLTVNTLITTNIELSMLQKNKMEKIRQPDISPKTDKWDIKQRSQKQSHTCKHGYARGNNAVGGGEEEV